MAVAVGIDLGTTNSVVSVYRRGRVETIMIEGKPTLASVVAFRDDNTVLVGNAAKRRMIIDPEHCIGSVKRAMGNKNSRFRIFDNTYTPADISAIILKKLRTEAEAALGTPINEAVITVPAYFDNNQKADTMKAGTIAGLNVLQLVPEPTAAAISYNATREDQMILIYDLGGGTFDLSVLQVTKGAFKVLAIDGDSQLGGDDFDMAIVGFLANEFKKKTSIDLMENTSPQNIAALQKLKEAAERAKCELSDSNETTICLPEFLDYTLEETISREQFTALIRQYLDRTVTKIRSVLKVARLNKKDIDRVILVGGSTRCPAVKQIVAEQIKEPYISEHVDSEVSRGAALWAANLVLPKEDFTPLHVQNITPHSLGLRVTKGKKSDKFKILIPRQTPLPAFASEHFSTSYDNQNSVEVSVFQGEKEGCSENTFIGGFILSGIPHSSAGVPDITIDFTMDTSDILQVKAGCQGVKGTIDLKVNMTMDTMAQKVSVERIFLLIDLSISMEGWKLDTTKKAIYQFLSVKSKSKKDLIGCATFSSTAHIAVPPTIDYDRIRKEVAGMSVNGSTNMAEGLKLVMQHLTADDNTSRDGGVLLLSDGEPDNRSDVLAVLSDFEKKGIRVDTVGAGQGYDRTLLEQIALKTNGKFEAANDIEMLLNAFVNLSER